MLFFKYFYSKTFKYDLINKFYYNKTKNLPKLKKIILNFSCKNNQLKNLSSSLLALELLTFKKSFLTKTKKSNILLKIRKGNPVGCKVVLRNKSMFTFLERIICEEVLNIGNSYKFKQNQIKNNFSFEIQNALIFKELENNYQLFNELNKLDFNVVLESHVKTEMIFTLNSLKFYI